MPELEVLNSFLTLSEETAPGTIASHLTGRWEKSTESFSGLIMAGRCALINTGKVLSCLI